MAQNSSTKTVRFDKFRPYYIKTDHHGVKTETLLDLADLFTEISTPEFKPTIKEIWGDKYRFNVCKHDPALNLWEVQLVHLREKVLPGMAGLEDGYDLIELPEGKFAAESCTILYDPQDCTLYLQRNSLCMSPKKLEMYFSEILPKGTRVALKVILADHRIDAVTPQKRYRKVVLVADTKEVELLPNGSGLRQLLTSYTQYGGKCVHIEIGMSRSRGWMNSASISKLVQEAYTADAIRKLEVNMADPDDTEFTEVDLLEDRACYRIPLEYDRSNPITHKRLYEACIKEYRQEHNR